MAERTDAERLMETQALVDKRMYSTVRSALRASAMREGRWVDLLGPEGSETITPMPRADQRSKEPIRLSELWKDL